MKYVKYTQSSVIMISSETNLYDENKYLICGFVKVSTIEIIVMNEYFSSFERFTWVFIGIFVIKFKKKF